VQRLVPELQRQVLLLQELLLLLQLLHQLACQQSAVEAQ
jgi:hypothetical protein